PAFTSSTRVIKKSEPYGIPPLVAARHLSPEVKARIRELLFSMHKSPEGHEILESLMIERFVPPKEEWYDAIRQMEKKLALMPTAPDALSQP
ncbi:MAG: PhnD/SsuA/transferrin family substrate-binding protein, partial [Deltaproteobacteria bacterium]